MRALGVWLILVCKLCPCALHIESFGESSRMFELATRINQIISSRAIHQSAVVFASPLRKKKQINPLITKKQFERKIRRLEREIAKLEAISLKLKPILELQLPPYILKEIEKRSREEKDEKAEQLLQSYYNAWSVFKSIERQNELKNIGTVRNAQKRALDLLQRDYPQLYHEAIQLDPELIPFKVDVVKKDTPPVDSYHCPDGREQDITKEWKL